MNIRKRRRRLHSRSWSVNLHHLEPAAFSGELATSMIHRSQKVVVRAWAALHRFLDETSLLEKTSGAVPPTAWPMWKWFGVSGNGSAGSSFRVERGRLFSRPVAVVKTVEKTSSSMVRYDTEWSGGIVWRSGPRPPRASHVGRGWRSEVPLGLADRQAGLDGAMVQIVPTVSQLTLCSNEVGPSVAPIFASVPPTRCFLFLLIIFLINICVISETLGNALPRLFRRFSPLVPPNLNVAAQSLSRSVRSNTSAIFIFFSE